MWLILSEPADASGAWLASCLARRTGHEVVHLTTRDLIVAAGEHAFDDAGRWFRLVASDGRAIESREVEAVVNRIRALPPGLARRLAAGDQAGAVRNFRIPLLASLHAFPGPVLNRPSAQGLSGDFRLSAEWRALAEQAGLRPLPAHAAWSDLASSPTSGGGGRTRSLDPNRSFLVVGRRVLAADCSGRIAPPKVARSCLALAALVRSTLLGIDLVPLTPDDWRFGGAHFQPDLTRGGVPVIEAIAAALRVEAGATTRDFSARALADART